MMIKDNNNKITHRQNGKTKTNENFFFNYVKKIIKENINKSTDQAQKGVKLCATQYIRVKSQTFHL